SLIMAWAVLLHVVLQPEALPWRFYGATGLDILLFSAFLHFGGGAVAGCQPLYLAAVCYAGWRFGRVPLIATALAGIAGFAAVVLSTDFWLRQPALAGGLAGALVVLPGLTLAAIGRLERVQAAVAGAEAERRNLFALFADALRTPAAVARAADSLLDYAALEIGRFTAPDESFALPVLVADRLLPLQSGEAAVPVRVCWRIDARLPQRLHGRARALERVLTAMVRHAIGAVPAATVRVAIDRIGGNAAQVDLRLRVSAAGEPAAGSADEAALDLRLVHRLVAMMGGELTIARPPGRGLRLTAFLSFAIEPAAAGMSADLGGRTVLIATEDGHLAEALAAPLAAWNADVRWVGAGDAAIAALARGEADGRAVVIVDGRGSVLPALAFAHRSVSLPGVAPSLLLIGDEEQLAILAELDDGPFDALLPMPLTGELLANAFAALPPAASGHPATAPPPGEAECRAGDTGFAERVTPIAAHPRFIADGSAIVDPRAIDELRRLGGGTGFVHDLADAFVADAQGIMAGVHSAVAAADAAGFARGLDALRRASRHLGATLLCDLLASLHDVGAGDLQRHGAVHAQRLDAEIARVAAQLYEGTPPDAVQP
ncbi:MAG TPA: hypothetical protein VJR70_09575, partial [Stellaceae bacterium]|nr:hypothetical protein [Stellaceae bacterium]